MKDLIKQFTEQEIHQALRNAGYKIVAIEYEDCSSDSDSDTSTGIVAVNRILPLNEVASYDFFQNNKAEAVFYREYKRRLLSALFPFEPNAD